MSDEAKTGVPVPGFPNLRRRSWEKGKSGNPSGRPQLRPISDALKKYINQPMARELVRKLQLDRVLGTEEITWGEVIAMRQMLRALKDLRAAEFVRDTIEGRPTQRIELGPSADVVAQKDYSGLSDEEIRELMQHSAASERLMRKARERRAVRSE